METTDGNTQTETGQVKNHQQEQQEQQEVLLLMLLSPLHTPGQEEQTGLSGSCFLVSQNLLRPRIPLSGFNFFKFQQDAGSSSLQGGGV